MCTVGREDLIKGSASKQKLTGLLNEDYQGFREAQREYRRGVCHCEMSISEQNKEIILRAEIPIEFP